MKSGRGDGSDSNVLQAFSDPANIPQRVDPRVLAMSRSCFCPVGVTSQREKNTFGDGTTNDVATVCGMVEFDFKRASRQCSLSGKPIRIGDGFYSALIEQPDGELVRQDYAEEHWNGPPDNCIGWWRTNVHEPNKGRVYWAPNEVIMAVFTHATADPAHRETAFVMALLLVRKRLLQWKEIIHRDGATFLRVHDAKQNVDYEVPELELPLERIQAIQAELSEKLFSHQQVADIEAQDEP